MIGIEVLDEIVLQRSLRQRVHSVDTSATADVGVR